jgi:drug/metabolite transporter (DMT)-like permease
MMPQPTRLESKTLMSISRRTLFIIFILLFSSGVTPIAIRLTQAEGVPSLVIVFIRLWLVALGLFPIIWMRYRQDLLNLTLRQLLLTSVAGFWLAMNLFMLFISLEYTSVLASSVLRRTTPLWIILPEIVLLSAVFSRRFWLSLAMTITGVIIIGIGGLTVIDGGSDPLLGAGLASFGAVCFGIYLLIGRQLNNAIPPLLYSFMVFLVAALVTTLIIIITQTSLTGYSPSGYLWALVVTFLAQVLGQIFINIGLQIFTATAMAIFLQIGVVVSAVIALFLFGEVPSFMQIMGSALVIVGVVMATIEQTQREQKRKNKTLYASDATD